MDFLGMPDLKSLQKHWFVITLIFIIIFLYAELLYLRYKKACVVTPWQELAIALSGILFSIVCIAGMYMTVTNKRVKLTTYTKSY